MTHSYIFIHIQFNLPKQLMENCFLLFILFYTMQMESLDQKLKIKSKRHLKISLYKHLHLENWLKNTLLIGLLTFNLSTHMIIVSYYLKAGQHITIKNELKTKATKQATWNLANSAKNHFYRTTVGRLLFFEFGKTLSAYLLIE